MLEKLLPYIPITLAHRLFDQPTQSIVGWVDRIEATVLFADASGFTAMSEALAKKGGRQGAEELTQILNAYFTPQIDLVHQYGGVIGKFGGDAMTIFFPRQGREWHVSPIKRALQCAIEMQKKMTQFQKIETSAGIFSLSMKIGISWGQLLLAVVGIEGVWNELILAGTVLDRTADAEHHATAGEIIVDKNIFFQTKGHVPLPNEITGKEWDQFIQISPVLTRYTSLSKKPLSKVSGTMDDSQNQRMLAPFLPPALYQRLQIGDELLINEHRKVTTLFLQFEGLDYDHDPNVVSKLQTYLTSLWQLVNQYEGTINKIDMGDKGSKAILLFGAPTTHENDEERALRCALDIIKLKPADDLIQRIGINTGFVFAGNVGSKERHEYTVMGDAVNLAARLMQAVDDHQILVGHQTFVKTQSLFDFVEQTPLQVKGKTDPVRVYTVANRRAVSQTKRFPMIGRRQELEQANALLEQAKVNNGCLLSVIAEAGMGKSRLAIEIETKALQMGYTGYGGECVSYGTNIPYYPWGELLRSFFGLNTYQTTTEQIALITKKVEDLLPAAVIRIPLLGDVLNIDIPDNAITQNFDPKLRQESLFTLIWELLLIASERQPIFLIFEDLHWIDPLSLELLSYIARNVSSTSLFLLLVFRPLDPILTNKYEPIARLTHHSQIELKELSPAESVELIHSRLNIPELPSNFKQLVLERSQGNPFFVEELIQAMQDTGVLTIDSVSGQHRLTGDISQLDIPDNLQSLIMSRIDRLDEQVKLTLKVASVIGRLFRMSVLDRVYPVQIDQTILLENLHRLTGMELTRLDKEIPEYEYLFKHVITQEVAYESLLFAYRRELHGRVAHYFEVTYTENLADFYEILAYHYGATENIAKQLEYYRRSGDKTRTKYANEMAVKYYTLAIEAATKLNQTDQILELLDLRSQVYELMGYYQQAVDDINQYLEVAEQAGRSLARGYHRLGVLYIPLGYYDGAEQHLSKARKMYEKDNDLVGVADSLINLGLACYYQNKWDEALLYYNKVLPMYKTLPDNDGYYRCMNNIAVIEEIRGNESYAISLFEQVLNYAKFSKNIFIEVQLNLNLAWIFWSQRDQDKAHYLSQQNLKLAREIGACEAELLILQQFSSFEYELGHYEKSLEYSEQALHIATYHTASPVELTTTHQNLGWFYYELGNWQQSLIHWQGCLAAAREMNDVDQIMFALRYQGAVYQRLGNDEMAKTCYESVLEMAIENENGSEHAQTAAYLGRLYAEQGDFSTAELLLTIAEQLIKDIDDYWAKIQVWQSQGRYFQLNGDFERAIEMYQHCLKITPDHDYMVLWEINGALGEIYQAQSEYETAILFYYKAALVMDQVLSNLSGKNRQILLQS